MTEKPAISVDEMAKLLGISRPNAFALAHSENFQAFRVGRRLLVNRAGPKLGWMNKRGGDALSQTFN